MSRPVCFHCGHGLDLSDPLLLLTGTCKSCLGALLSNGNEELASYLESLEVPAAVLETDHTVRFATRRFLELEVGGGASGRRAGEVLGCMYTTILGDCGETVPCMLCSLRRAIEQTRQTGRGLRGVMMSYPHLAEARKQFSVDTEPAGDAVLIVVQHVASGISLDDLPAGD
jgi:hypothetical protein